MESSTDYRECAIHCRRLAADTTTDRLHGNEGQQGQVAGTLDGVAHSPLVLGTNTALATGLYLGPVGDKTAEALVVLVINILDVFHAEGTHAPAGRIASPGPAAGSGSTGRARAAVLVATLGSARARAVAGTRRGRTALTIRGRCRGRS